MTPTIRWAGGGMDEDRRDVPPLGVTVKSSGLFQGLYAGEAFVFPSESAETSGFTSTFGDF